MCQSPGLDQHTCGVTMRVLIVEDNPDIAANVRDFLVNRGHVTDTASDGVTGLHFAVVNNYDAIVLDLMLPGIDGIEVCRKLRHDGRKSTPVLMLTVRDTLPDKLKGFDSGADDYLVKPFALQELEARLHVLVRRATNDSSQDVLCVADIELNQQTLRCIRAGQLINLSPIGLRILTLLMRETHRVVTHRQLIAEIWRGSPPDSDSLRAHMHILRSAIDQSFAVPLLHNIRGIGYRLVDPNEL